MEAMAEPQIEVAVAKRVIKKAHQVEIPLIAGTYEQMHGRTVIEILHYEYGSNLSFAEQMLINQMVLDAARSERVHASETSNKLQFTLY